MNINKKKTDYELAPEEDNYIDRKLEQITKLVKKDEHAICEVEIAKNKHQSGDVFYAEINLTSDGELFRATENGETVAAAFDKAKEEVVERLRRAKDKKSREPKRMGARIKDMFRFGK